jgi:hypothetical protein
MTLKQFMPAIGAAAALGATALTLTLTITAPRVHADSGQADSRIQIGFNIAPVKLNLKGLNPAKVGVGSYIVNAQGDCNGCHLDVFKGGEFSQDPTLVGVPPPGVVNPASYLGGGANFGTGGILINTPPGVTPGFYPRNLTPGCDINAPLPCTNPLPEGGTTLAQFTTILRTGHDFDTAHPNCPATGAEGCINVPAINGLVLQIMPWPTFAKMSDDDIAAIYEYLKAIPCISHKGDPGLPSILYQNCPAP